MKLANGKEIKVAIPLKTNSTRVPNKNLRPFAGDKSLFDVKIQQLLRTFDGRDVYVSSEDKEVANLCSHYGLNFLVRDMSLTPNSALWTDVVTNIVQQIPNDSDIMWVQVTQPLFSDFDKVLEKWNEVCEVNDSLAVVKKIGHHIVDQKGHPLNFEFGYWHKISQELPSLYEITWACFCMRREMVDKTGYQMGRNMYLYETDAPLVDIDTMQDFEVASVLYNYYPDSVKVA